MNEKMEIIKKENLKIDFANYKFATKELLAKTLAKYLGISKDAILCIDEYADSYHVWYDSDYE